ncbi:MAG: phosphotransferase [Gammaproteobacteria bacterium]|nr:phosphotransferase [Gammaproteobacteria bacterium]
MTSQLLQNTKAIRSETAEPAEAQKRRKLVLFPGAFRPPHKVHFNTVLALASRVDVDEVVIIITNRCRPVPGTSKVLDTTVALKIWSVYLQDYAIAKNKIRIEVAAHSAVKHALGYLDKVRRGDSVLFCVGEKDFQQGTGRFSKIEKLSEQHGVTASVVLSPVPELDGGATLVRSYLGAGITGRDAFMTSLPEHLSSQQCDQVWDICCTSMRDMKEIAAEQIQSILERNGISGIQSINCAKNKKTDLVFRVRLDNGSRVFVKYANDTVKADQLGQSQRLKPRSRLYAERRALKWLASNNPSQTRVPQVICFESKSKTLVLDDVSGAGRLLENDLQQGIFDTWIARQASHFLAACHTSQAPDESFWGSDEADRAHWKTILDLRTVTCSVTNSQFGKLPAHSLYQLQLLNDVSQKASYRAVYHLDYGPKNIFVHDQKISVIDFEMSSTISDPAFDFGCLLGHYLWWGMATDSKKTCLECISVALQVYQTSISTLWTDIASRIAPFSATVILSQLAIHSHHLKPVLYHQLLEAASTLLASNLARSEEIEQLFTVVSARVCNADRRLPTKGESHEFNKDYWFVH